MENKMIEVKESFWNKFKNFLKKVFLRNKGDLTNDEVEAVDKINEAYKHSERVEEEKIENIEKIIDRSENNLYKENQAKGKVNRRNVESEKIEAEADGNYKRANVNGKQIRCYEIDDGDTYGKRYVSIGEKECSYTNTNGVKTKRFVVYGHKENPLTIKGMNFTEKMRDKRLDIKLSETTKEGITEEVRKGPLLDCEDAQYKGSYEKKDTTYANGDRLVEDTKQVIDESGSVQSIYETHSHSDKGYIHTKYLNGQVVFQLVRDNKGTLIKEYDNKGNVINTYQYDKDGKPTETILVGGADGKVRRRAKTYKGIDEIPDDSLDNCFVNGTFVFKKENSNYYDILNKAGLPQSVSNILEQTYEKRIPQSEMTDFDKAKEQLEINEKTTKKNRTVKNEIDI